MYYVDDPYALQIQESLNQKKKHEIFISVYITFPTTWK